MNIGRRGFIRTIGSAAMAAITARFPALASLKQRESRKPRVAVFLEREFPAVDSVPIPRKTLTRALDAYDVTFLNAGDLKERLNAHNYDFLLTPYGSAFPKAAYGAISKFLVEGGAWVNLGGIPLSVPVLKVGNAWRLEVRQTVYHKKLGITQAFPVRADSTMSYRANETLEGSDGLLREFSAEEIYELYVRLTVTKDFPAEDGSAGARDAVLRTLVFGTDASGRRLAAPFVQIDRLQGEYAGGRWMLANFKGTLSATAIRILAEMALDGATELVARSSFACYEGELPSFTVQLRRPKGGVERLLDGDCSIEVLSEEQKSVGTSTVKLLGQGTVLTGHADMARKAPLPPGLYRVTVKQKVHSPASARTRTITHTTGFWVMDKSLLEGGSPLSLDKDYFLRDGKPYPVTGTTYMTSDVHRKFLLEPNPFLWNRDFAEMKRAGVNMVRTGIWTGWKNYMLDVGAPNEAALRAMDAFLLTARKHDIPIIFTFFAFLPETWGGANAYLDPRSVNAQKEFITAFTQRYRRVNDIIWDLINEPSFCSPEHLWICRPNYDAYEKKAWTAWLRERYPAPSADAHVAQLQEMYRSSGDEATELPTLGDFADAHIFGDRRPIKVIDYKRFAQDMFRDWVKHMTAAIRANGNALQLITVGQDENGAVESPSPQFFGDTVDFTSLHNWWLNDDLVWDGVVTKVTGKPNLVEETGMMFYEKMDGAAWRTEEEARNLLERKLAIAFATGGAGFVQWIWNTNPYMMSDNEAAIGLHRVDGTAKPELEPFVAISKFFSSNHNLIRGVKEPEVAMVIPHSQLFSTRNFASASTRRCIRVMHYHLNTSMAAVSEYRLDALRPVPKLIVLPAPRILQQKAWDSLLSFVERGSLLLVTGVIDADDHWLPVERSKQFGAAATTKPVAQEEFLQIDGSEYQLSHRGEKMQRIEKAVLEHDAAPKIQVIPYGKGSIIWSPLPVEISESVEPTVALYEYTLKRAGISPAFSLEKRNSSILVLATVFDEAVLYTFVSESDRSTEMKLTHLESKSTIAVKVPAQRTELMFVERKSGKVLSRLE